MYFQFVFKIQIVAAVDPPTSECVSDCLNLQPVGDQSRIYSYIGICDSTRDHSCIRDCLHEITVTTLFIQTYKSYIYFNITFLSFGLNIFFAEDYNIVLH